MDKRKDRNNVDRSLSSSDSQEQVIINMPPAVEVPQVLYLPDANLGTSETDDPLHSNQKVYLSGSSQTEMEKEKDFDEDEKPCTSSQSAETRQKSSSPEKIQSMLELSSSRMHNVLEFLCSFSRNLDAIAEREKTQPAIVVQVPQFCELATQTAEVLTPPRRLRLDVSTLRPDPNRPPCERAHHTITIRGNNMPPSPPQVRQTLCARIGRSIGDFIGAFCLCLQVNKDCVFCLGFFVAFVISASFLTAFFYRTLSFTSTPVRVAANPVSGTAHYELATLKFNGGYYYIYNSNQQRLQ
ncbi:uncharacterized protein LOC108092657 [Drosophila ficusphila]|uniref:uncharacterized protein LOC108092657 n=1 Tax=Drosophila ficusphila TaxID=30025 RepID=UPI001C894BF5|nr:uncharacterized protein LOC108092657 [Drosophila ficusphila]